MSDYSDIYSNKTGLITFSRGSTSIGFKPFLKSFSVNRQVKDSNQQVIEGLLNVRKVPFAANMPDYKMAFSVVAGSIDEAISNHKKMSKFFRLMYPAHNPSGNLKTKFIGMNIEFTNLISKSSIFGAGAKATTKKVLKASMLDGEGQSPTTVNRVLNNIVSDAVESLGGTIDTTQFETVTQYSPGGKLFVVCKALSYAPNIKLGFFEHKGMLWAKSFDISLSFESMDQKSLRNLKNSVCKD